MDRPIIYSTEQGRSTDFLYGQRAALIGLAKLSEAIFGTGTVVSGLAATPTGPAGLTVNVGPGQIYQVASVDATAYGALTADTTDQVVKQGLLMTTQNVSCPAPSTAGNSINYLIQATYQDQDLNNVVLPYYNSANPSQPLSGQNNTGAPQATQRQGVCVVSVKAGASATTGSQTTPAPDAGNVGLWVVTVANGQTQITSTSINAYVGAPMVATSGATKYSMQTVTATGTLGAPAGHVTTMVNSGSATTQTLPAASTVPKGTRMEFFNIGVGVATMQRAGADTIQVNSTTVTSIPCGNGDSLVLECDGVSVWEAIEGSARLGYTAAASAFSAPAGTMSNVKMAVAAASASGTLTADEVVVATALGGQSFRLASFNKTVNLATTGAGGMDTGTAPVSGFVALYAIYNPATQTAALLATNATSGAAGRVYGGANMPAGYTASGLVSVWPTDGTSKFKVGAQMDRKVCFAMATALTTSTSTGAVWTSLSLSSIVPLNARTIGGSLAPSNSSSASVNTGIHVASDSAGSGEIYANYALTSASGGGVVAPFESLPVPTPQTIWYEGITTAGTPTYVINVSSYSF